MDFNSFQERAVYAPGHCTILACPGSGKTSVLSHRAAHLITSNDIGRLVAVTFTKDASNELLQRISKSCGIENARRIGVGTFHSLALNQLRRSIKAKVPRLINEGERFGILRRCWKDFAPRHKFEDVVKLIDRAKGTVKPLSFDDLAVEKVFQAYEQALAADNVMDFSDLLLRSTRGMLDGSIAPLPIAWMLVDEAQDMDAVQLEWILAHGRAGVQVTLVGDDDQSLYSFRQALGYDGLQEITMALNSMELTLPVNYRCAPNILSHAAKLINHNTNRAAKNIKANKTTPGEVVVHRRADRTDELSLLAKVILESNPLGEWFVLARTNILLDEAEIVLRSSGIEVKRSGSKSIWDNGIGAVFTGLVRSVATGTWMGIANTLSFCGAGDTWINEHSRAAGLDLFERFDAAIETAPNDRSRKLAISLREGLLSWSEQAKKNRVPLVIFGITGFLSPHCKEPQRKLLELMQRTFAERLQGTLLQRLSLLSRDEKDKTCQEGVVMLLTLHSSKGLEADNVWIMGCEEGNLPHTDSTEEDERRLMYVGMTRARSRLVMSSSLSEGMESRFFEEAGLAPK